MGFKNTGPIWIESGQKKKKCSSEEGQTGLAWHKDEYIMTELRF